VKNKKITGESNQRVKKLSGVFLFTM